MLPSSGVLCSKVECLFGAVVVVVVAMSEEEERRRENSERFLEGVVVVAGGGEVVVSLWPPKRGMGAVVEDLGASGRVYVKYCLSRQWKSAVFESN